VKKGMLWRPTSGKRVARGSKRKMYIRPEGYLDCREADQNAAYTGMRNRKSIHGKEDGRLPRLGGLALKLLYHSVQQTSVSTTPLYPVHGVGEDGMQDAEKRNQQKGTVGRL